MNYKNAGGDEGGETTTTSSPKSMMVSSSQRPPLNRHGSYVMKGSCIGEEDVTSPESIQHWIIDPISMSKIQSKAFFSCRTLLTIDIPTTIVKIAKSAFLIVLT